MVWSGALQDRCSGRLPVKGDGGVARERALVMHNGVLELEMAAWAVAEGGATADEVARLETDRPAFLRTVGRLIDETVEKLDSVRRISGPEREQVVADFEEDLDRLRAVEDALVPRRASSPASLV